MEGVPGIVKVAWGLMHCFECARFQHQISFPLLLPTHLPQTVFYVAGVCVVFDKERHLQGKTSQRFFFGHSNDILCLTQHPGKRLFASGQQAGARVSRKAAGGETDLGLPYVCIWDSEDCSLVQRIDHGKDMRGVVACGFSGNGLTGDDRSGSVLVTGEWGIGGGRVGAGDWWVVSLYDMPTETHCQVSLASVHPQCAPTTNTQSMFGVGGGGLDVARTGTHRQSCFRGPATFLGGIGARPRRRRCLRERTSTFLGQVKKEQRFENAILHLQGLCKSSPSSSGRLIAGEDFDPDDEERDNKLVAQFQDFVDPHGREFVIREAKEEKAHTRARAGLDGPDGGVRQNYGEWGSAESVNIVCSVFCQLQQYGLLFHRTPFVSLNSPLSQSPTTRLMSAQGPGTGLQRLWQLCQASMGLLHRSMVCSGTPFGLTTAVRGARC